MRIDGYGLPHDFNVGGAIANETTITAARSATPLIDRL
jgi:hypothetical protein